MAKNQIDMNSVSLPSVPKPPTQKDNAGFDFNNQSSSNRRQSLMGEMPEMNEIETDESQTAAGRLGSMLDSGSPLMKFRRTHPDLLTLANTLGYTDAQLDALFGVNA